MTLTVMILRAGLRLPATGIALTAREGLKQTPAPCQRPGSASCLTGPAARAPALDRRLFPSPLPRASPVGTSRGLRGPGVHGQGRPDRHHRSG